VARPTTARQAGSDPPHKEHTRRGNAYQGGSEQQHRHPSQGQNSDQQHKDGDADGSQRPNLDASGVAPANAIPGYFAAADDRQMAGIFGGIASDQPRIAAITPFRLTSHPAYESPLFQVFANRKTIERG
jgi:hypothetical protein